ncbi:putative glycosidase crf1 [Ceratocystis platani]|uniref:Crh-like protein n=1 Tax=Ceratocystis fimbriata f. sp. platani TaxID=88771 RepID=A0A0F8DCF5_CERFI|nr:putative glycosidase crf1 [Ceratocystis platani]
MFVKFSSLASVASMASLALAQTYTLCNPTKETCPADAAVGGSHTIDFTKDKIDELFTAAQGTDVTYDDKLGAVFDITKETNAPTISSKGFIFFGRVEVTMRVAPGTGIVTSAVLQSNTLDEIDWEWLGGKPNEVQTNFFSKGNTSTYDRGGITPMSDATETFHTYTIDWTAERIEWILDDKVIRTLTYADSDSTQGYPQTPMQIKLGTWVGGSSTASEGTVEWAGGKSDFSNNNSYKAYYQKIVIEDYMGGNKTAGSYVYTDKTGAWQSIEVSQDETESNSTTTDSSVKPKSSDSTTLSTSTRTSTASSSTGTGSRTGTGSGSASSTGSSSNSSNSSPSGSASASTTSTVTGAASKMLGSTSLFAACVALFMGIAL